MRLVNRILLFILCILGFSTANVEWARAELAQGEFIVLNYHDILEQEEKVPPFDRIGVCQQHLEDHFLWLRNNGYHVVSIQDVLAAMKGTRRLPSRAVLLTFDDGYLSFYTRAMPLLKKFHYPATVAIVGQWVEQGGKVSGVKPLMSAAQIREVMASGLVEVASHTHDLHQSVPSNPQGNLQSAVTSRIYSAEYDEYENDENYRARIFMEVEKSSEKLYQLTGQRPRVMVWPFGEYNQIAIEAAKKAGMQITMALNDGVNTLADGLAMKRMMLTDDPDANRFAKTVKEQRSDQQLRVAHVDLDYIYDDEEAQTNKNISSLIDRIKESGANTVYLQAYSDPDGDGNADKLYFPNRHLPVRRDLFNHVALQLMSRAGVRVYAWMPIMAYKADVPIKWYVKEWRDGEPQMSRHIYTRLSPFNPEARRYITEIYEDLAKNCSFNGILFHDDGLLTDYEDVSPLGLDFAHQVWGLPADFAKLHGDPKLRLKWAKHKTEFISQFTDELADRVRYYRPYLKTARNMYALPILQPYSEEWYAQSFSTFMKHYDYVAVEAMPFMEKAKDPKKWLTELVRKTGSYKGGLNKMVFELQTVDWEKHTDIPMATFTQQFKLLKKNGAKHIGYYPDNQYHDNPKLGQLKTFFSVEKKD